MNELYVLIGVAGVGKSTWTKKQNVDVIFSSDEYREKIFKTLEKQDEKDHKLIFETMHNDLFEYLKNNTNKKVIYDATNLSAKRRKILKDQVLKFNTKVIAVIFFETYEKIKERNEQREKYKQVPEHVTREMYKSICVPRKGYDCDDILTVGTKFFKKMNFENVNDLNDILMHIIDENARKEIASNFTPHESSYHKESVDEHIRMVMELSEGKNHIIATFHDLGKGFCKEKTNAGFASYKQHENVSAYYFLNYMHSVADFSDEMFNILFQIKYHMFAHAQISSKTLKKYKISEEMYNNILEFGKIDSAGKIT